jgi:hypothetical protein
MSGEESQHFETNSCPLTPAPLPVNCLLATIRTGRGVREGCAASRVGLWATDQPAGIDIDSRLHREMALCSFRRTQPAEIPRG